MIKQWIFNVYYALDCLGSAVIGLDKNEPISSALGKLHVRKVYSAYPVIYLVNTVALILFQQTDHCKQSIMVTEGLFTSMYDGSVSPDKVVKFVIPLQIIGLFVLFNFNWIISIVIFWE